MSEGFKHTRSSGGAHPDVATHDALGLATDAELTTHAATAHGNSFATNALVLGSAAAAGAAATTLRSNDTIAAFDVTAPSTQAFGDAAAVGVIAFASRRDHKHAMPADPVTAHVAAADPHAGYVLESLIDLKGDLITATAADTPARLAVGADGLFLKANSAAATGLEWAAGGSGAPTGVDYLVGTADATLTNEIVVGATPNGELGGTWGAITIDATHSGSAHADFIAKALADAKGDLFAATAADTVTRLAVGLTNGHALVVDSLEATGMKWAAVTAGLPEHEQWDKSPLSSLNVAADFSSIIFRSYTIADGNTLTLGDAADFVIL